MGSLHEMAHPTSPTTMRVAQPLVSRGQPLPLDEGRVWSTDVDLFVSENNRKLVGVKCQSSRCSCVYKNSYRLRT